MDSKPKKKKRCQGKGSQFERDIARTLSKWWTKGERDDVFWRSAMSGGMATVRAKKGKSTVNQIGDLVAVDPVGAPLLQAFVIELKRGYKAWSVQDLLDNPRPSSSVLHDFLEQVKRECETAGIPDFLLICKRDRRNTIVISNRYLAHLYDKQINFYYDGTSYYVCTLADFLTKDPQQFIRRMRR